MRFVLLAFLGITHLSYAVEDAELDRLIAKSRELVTDREITGAALLARVKSGGMDNERKEQIIFQLGELKYTEAIDYLIENLDFKITRSTLNDEVNVDQMCPCIAALKKMDAIAMEKLIQAYALFEDKKKIALASLVLSKINKNKAVEYYLKGILQSADSLSNSPKLKELLVKLEQR